MTERARQVRARWRNLIAEREASGQSVTAFCCERGLGRSHFYYWQRQLREVSTPQFVEVQLEKPDVGQRCSALGSVIEVRLSNGRSLMVAPEFDASHLRAVLAVVESAS